VADEPEETPGEDAAAATEVHDAAEQPAAAPPEDTGGTSPAAADREASESHDPFTDKPELFVAGAFVGAFVLGKVLKKITAGGD
jgi:hypothetical protein